MQSICIYCGSSKGNNPSYSKIARETGAYFAARNIKIVYGAGNVGLMQEVADGALEAGGEVIGVIPEFLKKWEVCHEGLTDLHVFETMHQRKSFMAEISDGFLALPGGFGTLDELFEIMTWKQLHLHKKTVGILNVNGYFDHALAQIDHMVNEGFLKAENRDMIHVDTDINSLMEKMLQNAPIPSEGKWIG